MEKTDIIIFEKAMYVSEGSTQQFATLEAAKQDGLRQAMYKKLRDELVVNDDDKVDVDALTDIIKTMKAIFTASNYNFVIKKESNK